MASITTYKKSTLCKRLTPCYNVTNVRQMQDATSYARHIKYAHRRRKITYSNP